VSGRKRRKTHIKIEKGCPLFGERSEKGGPEGRRSYLGRASPQEGCPSAERMTGKRNLKRPSKLLKKGEGGRF